ncbi:MAG TPA: response regulator, partial [Herpetosiphonaceae bacterium]
ALLLSREHQEPIDLLLTDVVMPGALNGRELAERLLALRPSLKVMYMSGYADSMLIRQEIAESDRAFLAKPFTAGGLLDRVGEALAGGR